MLALEACLVVDLLVCLQSVHRVDCLLTHKADLPLRCSPAGPSLGEEEVMVMMEEEDEEGEGKEEGEEEGEGEGKGEEEGEEEGEGEEKEGEGEEEGEKEEEGDICRTSRSCVYLINDRLCLPFFLLHRCDPCPWSSLDYRTTLGPEGTCLHTSTMSLSTVE